MTLRPRRIALQLTPLLDLMLIVIFAQYLEMRETEGRRASAFAARQADLGSDVTALQARHAADLAKIEAERSAQAARLATTDERRAALERDLRTVEEERSELAARLERALARQEQIGNVLRDAFRLPPEVVARVLSPENGKTRSDEDIARLQGAVRELAEKRGRDVVRHVLTVEEIRKRCDVWELHVRGTDAIALSTGERTAEFRADSPETFTTRLFDRYKSLPQPKGLVIILVSYGDATVGTVRAVLDGLPAAVSRLQADSGGRTRFEYAVLGFDPDRTAEPPPRP
jgi:hypothetical protein